MWKYRQLTKTDQHLKHTLQKTLIEKLILLNHNGKVWHFGEYTYLLSCRELDEMIVTNLMALRYGQLGAGILSGEYPSLAWH